MLRSQSVDGTSHLAIVSQAPVLCFVMLGLGSANRVSLPAGCRLDSDKKGGGH